MAKKPGDMTPARARPPIAAQPAKEAVEVTAPQAVEIQEVASVSEVAPTAHPHTTTVPKGRFEIRPGCWQENF